MQVEQRHAFAPGQRQGLGLRAVQGLEQGVHHGQADHGEHLARHFFLQGGQGVGHARGPALVLEAQTRGAHPAGRHVGPEPDARHGVGIGVGLAVVGLLVEVGLEEGPPRAHLGGGAQRLDHGVGHLHREVHAALPQRIQHDRETRQPVHRAQERLLERARQVYRHRRGTPLEDRPPHGPGELHAVMDDREEEQAVTGDGNVQGVAGPRHPGQLCPNGRPAAAERRP